MSDRPPIRRPLTLEALDTRDNNITLMRLIAAWMVLYSHSWVLLGQGAKANLSWPDRVSFMVMPFNMKLSGVAVAMFFVLSGFLIAKSFARRKSLAHYGVSRALRIYPALWVNLLFCVFVIGPLFTPFSLGELLSSQGPWNFLKTNAVMMKTQFRLMGGQEIFPGNPNPFGINGSLWTLPAELRAYILVFVFGVLGAFRSRIFFAVALAGILAGYAYWGSPSALVAHPAHFRLMLFFLIGVLAYVYRAWVPVSLWGLVAAVVVSALVFKTPAFMPVGSLALGYAFIVLAYHPALRLPPIDGFGDLSYGLYLYAFPVQQALITLDTGMNPYVLVAGTTVIAGLLAALSWFGVERPALRAKDRLAGLLLFRGSADARARETDGIAQRDTAW